MRAHTILKQPPGKGKSRTGSKKTSSGDGAVEGFLDHQ